MSTDYSFLVNARQRGLPIWQRPVWQVNPVLTDVTIGHVVAVSAGSYIGTPTPVVTYLVYIDGVQKTWPYTLQIADAGKTLQVVVLLTNAAGVDYSVTLVAVPTTLIAPGPVVGMSTSAPAPDGFTVSWQAPISGGTPASYTVGYRVSGTQTWTTQTTSALTFTLTALASTTTYDVEVFGTNVAGNGPATIQQRATTFAGAGSWPVSELGMNVPGDKDYSSFYIFTNRALTDLGSFQNYGTLDANGMPTSVTEKKLSASAVGHVYIEAGDWAIIYTAASQRVMTTPGTSSAGTMKSSVWDSGTGKGVIVWTYPANSTQALVMQLDGPVGNDLLVLNPADYAAYLSAGNTYPFWNQQFLRTCYPYDYLRFMDVSGVNGDFTTNPGTANAVFRNGISYSDLNTPATYHLNTLQDSQQGWALQWMVDLCNQTNRGGWFNISANLSDAGVTAFGAYVAANLNAGLKAKFEYANETWNTGAGYKSWYKNGVAGLTEVRAAVGSNWYSKYGKYDQRLMGITLDGTKAIVRTLNPHGATTGDLIQFKSLASAYASYNTGNVSGGTVGAAVALTVIDAYNVSYPCTTAAAGEVAGTVLLGSSGFLALNASSDLLAAAGTQDDLSYFYCHRRQYDVAKLLKAAFVAAGRGNDCQTMLAQQAGINYYYYTRRIENFYTATGRTDALKNVFTATCLGGYLSLAQNSLKGGYSISGTYVTPSGADVSTMTTSVLDQLKIVSDRTYSLYSYTNMISWAKSVGLQAWIYEIGLDVYGTGGDTQAQKDGKVAAQSDPRMTTIIRDFFWGMQELGFTAMGWFQCGAGTYVDTGCFNLGNSISEIDYTSDPSIQSAKFKGLLASKTPPATIADRPQSVIRTTNHEFPCSISGYDVVGNESVTVENPNDWPFLNGTNLNLPTIGVYTYCYSGPSKNGLTVCVRSESARTVTLELTGRTTTSGNKTIGASVLGSGSTQTIVASGNVGTAATGVVLGTCSLDLQAGLNYVFVNSVSSSAAVSISQYRFF